jgi:hypothetical protein
MTDPSSQLRLVRGARIAGVSLDCGDHHELATFYARLLDGKVNWATDTAAGVTVGTYTLVAQKVSPYVLPRWPGASIVHLDLTCTPSDLPAFQERAEQYGATVAATQPDGRWVVMLDPAGHPFCLTPITG